ncbi:sodium- and chloride-dependent glycine transporter 1-like [Glandiceps talaboti]
MAQKNDDGTADLWATNEGHGTSPTIEMKDMKIKNKKTKPKDENPIRGNWSKKAEFILAALGSAVGLGNVWRFPYLCFENGGATFLVPYAIMLVLAGLPIFFLEMALGQFSSLGCVSVWRCVPLFRGLGWAMVVVSVLVSIYYNVVMSWAIYYFFASFANLPSVPWVGCGHEWNTDSCFDDRDFNDTVNTTAIRMTMNNTRTAADEYFKHSVLKASSSIDETGSIHWHSALCLLLAWLLVYFCLIRGIKSAGKVVYFTATAPYALILLLLIRGVTLEGAKDGITFYIAKVDWDKLKTATVWKDAAGQIFYSLSASAGGLHTLASYNKFHNNLFVDAISVALLNCLTSLFAGFAVFSVLGHMAFQTGKSVEEVGRTYGPSLAFVVYPEALSRLPIAPFWSALFFFTVVILAIDSMFVLVETIVTALLDEFKYFSVRRKVMKWILPIVYCTAAFLLGFPLISQAGIYWVGLMDSYSTAISLVIIGLIECLTITYIYGIHNFYRDIRVMLGHTNSMCYWFMVWVIVIIPLVIAPVALGLVAVFFAIDYTPSDDYPAWAIILGWLITASSLSFIVLYMPYHFIFKGKGNFSSTFVRSLRPTPDWGPALNEFREEAGYRLFPTISEKSGAQSYPRPGAQYLYPESVSEGTQCDFGEDNNAYDFK